MVRRGCVFRVSGDVGLPQLLLASVVVAALAFGFVLQERFGLFEEFGIHVAPWTNPVAVDGLNKGFFLLVSVSGRPLGAVIYWAVERLAPWMSIDCLSVYRLIGMFLALASASLVAWDLADVLRRRSFSYLAAAVFALLPAISVHIVQGHIFAQPVAGMLSYAATHRLIAMQGRFRGGPLLIAVALSILANFIYQPWAMMGFLIALLYALRDDVAWIYRLQTLVMSGVISGIGLAMSAAAALLTMHVTGATLDRLDVATNLFDRLVWFVRWPLAYAGSGFLLEQHWVSVLVGLGGVLLVVSLDARTHGERWLRWFALWAALPIFYAPKLASKETFLQVRTLPILSVGIACLCVVALDRLVNLCVVRVWCSRYTRVAIYSGCGALLMLGIVCSGSIARRMTTPLVLELAFVRQRVAVWKPDPTKRIVLVRPSGFGWAITGEVGAPNAVMDFSLVDMVRVVLEEQYPDLPVKDLNFEVRITDAMLDEVNEQVIDLRPVYTLTSTILSH